jgi:hypothetical protein
MPKRGLADFEKYGCYFVSTALSARHVARRSAAERGGDGYPALLQQLRTPRYEMPA